MVLHGHGFGGSRAKTPNALIQKLLDQGYGVISIDQHGFGESGGTVRVLDPDFEGKDLLQILDWAEATLPWLQYRGGNLVLGSVGGSYGGGYQLLIHAIDPKRRLDALVPDITWNDLRYSLNPNDVVKSGWALLLVAGGESGSGGTLDDYVRTTLAQGVVNNRFPADGLEWFNYHSLNYHCDSAKPNYAGGNTPRMPVQPVPVLLTQGFRDTLFNFNDAWDNYNCLKNVGADVRLVTHQTGHLLPQIQPAAGKFQCGALKMDDLTLSWFKQYLKQESLAATDTVVPNEMCLSLADDDAIFVPANTNLVGGLTSKILPALMNVPNGAPARAAGPSAGLLGTVAGADLVIAGIPEVTITIAPTSGVASPAADPIMFLGLGVKRGGTGNWALIDDQLTPVRGLKTAVTMNMTGIAERLKAGDQLGFMVFGFHDQYPESGSRDATTPAVNVSGSIKLPIRSGSLP